MNRVRHGMMPAIVRQHQDMPALTNGQHADLAALRHHAPIAALLSGMRDCPTVAEGLDLALTWVRHLARENAALRRAVPAADVTVRRMMAGD
jgi:hypothetical protein